MIITETDIRERYFVKNLDKKDESILDFEDIIKRRRYIKQQSYGVYFLFSKDKIVYVGKTTVGEKRVFAHTKDKVFDSYSFIPCSRSVVTKLENIYIKKFSPHYNISGNPNRKPKQKIVEHNGKKYRIVKAIKDTEIKNI